MNKMFKSCLLIVNRDCNLSCKFCSSKKDIDNTPWSEMKKAVKIIDKFTDFTVIMGGEPLIYEHIYDLISLMSEMSMDFTIVTNGSLLDTNNILKLKTAGLKNITVSYDCIKGLTFDEMLNLKKIFEDVTINIMYDYTLVGYLHPLISSLSDNNIWSIVALYNFSNDDREHYLIGKKLEEYTFKAYQTFYIDYEIGKILKNFNNLLIHNSIDYIRNIPNYLHVQDWRCRHPYRLVVNNNLKIMPCEDYKPFEDIDIFKLNEMLLSNHFDLFHIRFQGAISECKGCYLPCYYDLEILTPLEIAHKGGKNVNYNTTGLSLCVRSKNREIEEFEDHICWFCGSDIRIKSSYDTFCKECGLMKCTSCGKCFCDATDLEKEFLRWVNRIYCGNIDRLVLFHGLKYGSVAMPREFSKISKKMIKNTDRCLKRCSKYTRGK